MKKNLKKLISLFVIALMVLPTLGVNATGMTIDKKTYIYTGSRKEAKFHTNKGYAYCITPHRTGPAQGTSLSYYGKQTSGGVLYLLENAGTSDSEYLATQLAIWQFDSNYMPEFYTKHSSYDVVKKAKSLASEAKKNKDYQSTMPTVKISGSNTTLTKSGDVYRSGELTVSITGAKSANLELESAPSGTTIVDSKSNAITSVSNNGSFYVQIPASKLTKDATFTVKASVAGQTSIVERYTTGNTKWQDLVVLVKENKTITNSKSLSVKVVRTCEKYNDEYYGKDGSKVTQEEYSIQCEKHTCEKVGNTYFGKNGTQVTKEEYSIQCEKHTCEKVGDTYFGKNGTEVTKEEYSAQCEKHTCEKVGDKYFGKEGTEVTKDEYSAQCEKHTCEKVGDKYFGKEGTEVTKEEYSAQCEKHTCEKVGDKYFGKNGQETDEKTYKEECTTPETHICEKVNDKYFDKEGKEVTEDEYIKQCVHTCEIYDNNYYGKDGKIVTESEYKDQCEAQVVPVPDTETSDVISTILGSMMLGSVGFILLRNNTKRRNA